MYLYLRDEHGLAERRVFTRSSPLVGSVRVCPGTVALRERSNRQVNFGSA